MCVGGGYQRGEKGLSSDHALYVIKPKRRYSKLRKVQRRPAIATSSLGQKESSGASSQLLPLGDHGQTWGKELQNISIFIMFSHTSNGNEPRPSFHGHD